MDFLLTLYTFALAALNGIRILDSTYWGDEIFSINLINMPIKELLRATANDVHPPLYYLILKGICHFTGQSGPMLHAVSLLPYLIVLVLALTVIRSRFGKSTAFLFVTFASLLQNAVRYNVEIRMYSWVVLFVLVSYLSLYEILYHNRWADYVLFILSSLAAAYTHYYALIAVAFFYLVLMLYAILRRREIVLRVVMTWILTALGYSPWLIVLIRTFFRTSSDWWMTWMPKFSQSFEKIFSGKYSWIMFWIYLAVLAGCAAYWIMEIVKKKTDPFKKDPEKELVWFIAGTASVFGTVAVGVAVSHLFRPLYFDRYVYTAAVCSWLTVSVGLSRFRIEKIAILSLVMTLFVGYCGYFNYTTVYEQDKLEAEQTDASVRCIEENTGTKDAVILTDGVLEPYLKVYFPKTNKKTVDLGKELELEEGREYCLVISSEVTQEMMENLLTRGVACTEQRPEMFKDDPDKGAFLGDLNCWIYAVGR